MSRSAWSLFAYQLIEPDEQLDLFACQEMRVKLVDRPAEHGCSAARAPGFQVDGYQVEPALSDRRTDQAVL